MKNPNCPYPSSPFIIYAGSKRPEHVSAELKKGVLGVTNDPHKTTLKKMLFYKKTKNLVIEEGSEITLPPDLGWLLVSQCQHDRHDQESYTGEEIGADGYEAGGDSPELQSNE